MPRSARPATAPTTAAPSSRAPRAIALSAASSGRKQFWRGFQIGCYTCHLGPATSDPNPNRARRGDGRDRRNPGRHAGQRHAAGAATPTGTRSRCASSRSRRTAPSASAATLATYIPEPGFQGADPFTFAAWDGSTDSNLGTVTVDVGSGGGTTTTTLPGGLGPDLTGRWVSLSQMCAGMGDGLRCTLRGKFIVMNQGTSRAGRSKLRFVLDGAMLKQRKVGKLKPGQAATRRFSATLRGQSASGTVVVAVVDATNAVAESNESNNSVRSAPIP